jgi:hypothetical protein
MKNSHSIHLGLRSEAVHASTLRTYFTQRKSFDTTPCILQSTSLFIASFIPLLQLIQLPAFFISGTPLLIACRNGRIHDDMHRGHLINYYGLILLLTNYSLVMPLFYIIIQSANMANHGKYDSSKQDEALF